MTQTPCRVRELGVVPGVLPPGKHNALTDVPGIRVGHTTIDDGGDLHTGVTAIVPDGLGRTRRTFPGALFVGNGHGKLVGGTQLDELGVLETPIVLTATLSVFRAADAVLSHMLALPGYEDVRSLNPLVGETNDGWLSDIRRRPITEADVRTAIREASADPPAEGNVGAGTGTMALGYKAGIGTSSRTVQVGATRHGVGALVQSNFSGRLQVLGVPLPPPEALGRGPDSNSCMIVLATDAPLDARQLARLARRGVFAMARVGAAFASGSGDYAIALSTAPESSIPPPDQDMDGLFTATLESVEEALLDSLTMSTAVVGFGGNTAPALPHDAVRSAGRLAVRPR